MSHDPHLGFVIAAYALAFVIVTGMIAAILADYIRLKQALSSLSHGTRQDPDIGRRELNPQNSDPEKASNRMTATVPRREVEPPATRRPLLIFVPLILFAALAALFVIRLYSGDASLLPSALIGREVPAFALPPIEGLPDKPGFSDADLRQGKATLVNVFASWCVPCHQEHELIMRLSTDPALLRAGVRWFGLAYKDEPEHIRRFLAEAGDPFVRIGADRKGRTAIDFGVYGVPETFVVKGDGMIAFRFAGPITEESYREVILPEIEKARR